MPRRTLSPRISTTVTVMSLLMTILSFFFLDSTSIAAYPSLGQRGLSSDSGSHALTSVASHGGIGACFAPDIAAEVLRDTPVKIPFPCRNQARASAGGFRSFEPLGMGENPRRC